MKFTVSSTELLKHLQICGGAINANPVMPILEDFNFSIQNNFLTITASDLETSITSSLEVMSDSDGKIAIPGRILIDTLKALPQQPITFRVDENYGVQITSSFGKYKLAGENPEEYPEIPEPEAVDTVSMPCKSLINGINKTIFAASNDEMRAAMSGVFFQVDFDKITLVATDAHKLVRFIYSGLSNELSTTFIIPKKSLILLKNSLPDIGTVTIAFNKANAFFKFNDIQMSCRLIDSKYPDFKTVIPVNNELLLTIPRTDFLNSLKRIAIYANKTTNQVVFNIKEEELTVSTQDLDFSNEASETIPCRFEGAEDEEFLIAFNAKFLVEMLGVLESDEVQIELSLPNRPGILLPTENEDNETIMMLVMPVMLSR